MKKVQIRVDTIYSRLISFLPKEINEFLDEEFSEWVKNSIFSTRYIEGAWDGKWHHYNLITRSFRTGLLPKVISCLRDLGYEPELIDERPVYELKQMCTAFETLRTEQSRAVDNILLHKRGIIEAPVRFGKTVVAIELARRTSLFPFLFVSQEVTPAMQACEKFSQWLNKVPNLSIGLCCDGKVNVGDITICTIQTIASALGLRLGKKDLKYLGIEKAEKEVVSSEKETLSDLVQRAKAVVIDEAHHGASRVHKGFLSKCKSAEFIVGLTATVPKTLELEAVLGPVIYSLSFDDAIKSGYILPPKIYLYKYSDDRELYLEDKSFSEVYNLCITENPIRNKLIVKIVQKAIEQKKSVVVTVRYMSHGELLTSLVPEAIFLHGKTSSAEREKILDKLSRKELFVVVSTLLKEAVDIPSLDMVVNASGGYSDIATIQRLRSITPDGHKSTGLLVDFFDDYKYLRKHSKRRLFQYKKKNFQIIVRDLRNVYF